MKLAVISPISMLDTYSTDFHLVLTQYYLSSSTYREFYISRRLKGDFIILDNGAAELKASVDKKDMMDVVRELQPHVVVAPDVIYDVTQTMHLTATFLAAHAVELHHLGVMIMAVPQGGDRVQWRVCFDDFNRDKRIDWLGISMFYTPKFNRRWEVLKSIESTISKPCHLLGLWDNPYALEDEKQFEFVKSVDTAKTVEFGLEGLQLSEWNKHKHIDDDWYFGLDKEICRVRSKHIEDNIREMKRIVQ